MYLGICIISRKKQLKIFNLAETTINKRQVLENNSSKEKQQRKYNFD